MRDSLQSPGLIRRSDYQAASHAIESLELEFDLGLEETTVLSRFKFSARGGRPAALVLAGDGLELLGVAVNGRLVSPTRYESSSQFLRLPAAALGGAEGLLEIRTRVYPKANTELMGLYASQGGLYTQCESEGFRRITYFLDRPDVMTTYRVTLRGNAQAFPVMLSNGNLLEERTEGNRRICVWHDPFPKPSYLFALVAADLDCIEETLTSKSGESKLLQVYTRKEDLGRADFALASLKRAALWDEQRFGLELDLERFMIVAVPDFNSGAMENKGLNLFNTKYVLADADTATDRDFELVEAVIGHEYFHNWTGNRITCRDWFQLTLKEGLTVFRDQEFTADMLAHGLTAEQAASSRAVKRIEDVKTLRAHQFPEDAGPMAHPIRPAQYQEIRNFYTATVYEKGAEVIRMLQTILGIDGFRKGMDLYFARHDGQAATCEDFVCSILEANERADLIHSFLRWYDTLGTPRIRAAEEWDAEEGIYRLCLEQEIDPRNETIAPLPMPVAVGLLSGASGHRLISKTEQTLLLAEPKQFFEFRIPPGDRQTKPIPSLFRDFSAPVVLEIELPAREWIALAQFDTDPFNQWDACQRLIIDQLRPSPVFERQEVLEALLGVLRNPTRSDAFKALALAVPSESVVAEAWASMDAPVDPSAIRRKLLGLQSLFAGLAQCDLIEIDQAIDQRIASDYNPNAVHAGRRSLQHWAQGLLTLLKPDSARSELLLRRFHDCNNMTTRMATLQALVAIGGAARAQALEAFALRYQDNALALDKWFTVQAATTCFADLEAQESLEVVQTLLKSQRFDRANPNRVRSLLGAYFMHNQAGLHRADGQGYALWSEELAKLDRLNGQLTSRLARSLDRWRVYEPGRRALMKQAIESLASSPGLSADTSEICQRLLEDA